MNGIIHFRTGGRKMSAKIEFNKLKERRIEMDITQKDLSIQSGVALNIVKLIETGKTSADKGTIEKVAKVLGYDLHEVYFEDYKDTKVIGIINNKGGSGKTSVCGNLAYALSELGNKILLIDSDMQQNLTHSYNLGDNIKNLAAAIHKEETLQNYIIKSEYENIDFIVADLKLSTIDMILFTKMQRENILKNLLKPVIESGVYDYILIDTNPTLAILNFNVINSSHFIVIPVELSSFGLEGLDVLIDFIKGVQKLNETVKIAGIVINKYDIRKKSITNQSEELLRDAYKSLIFETILRVDTSIENAQMLNVPVLCSHSNSRISNEYRDLAKEVIKIVKQ
jgi:chromosome partitioning protein